ncbi:MAG: L,D-transpeptidase [Acidobacteria bacterium]|nr:L,D-transpeptidase [Acidobacteriota bacterium]
MKKIVTTGMALSLVIVIHTCKQMREGADSTSKRQVLAPQIEISPLEQGRGQWKIATSDSITVTVTAPGAERVRIQCRPEWIEGDYLEFRTLAAAVDRAGGRYVARLNLAPDFAGDVWAEASYPDGTKKRTEAIALTAETADAGIVARLDEVGGSVGTDESARSDKLNGGRIRGSKLIAGEPGIRITVNAPAFLLTLWQNGKVVSAYHIGIGNKNFPVPVGEREATAIIFNPQWIPSDSAWAPRSEGFSTFERIMPNGTRPHLSKIKISLSAGYMIHEAVKADDIGRTVSRGSILMVPADLFDLAEKIITARDPPFEKSRIAQWRDSHERLAMPLDPPLLVDINYDLQVVEGGTLHIYPDVYDRGAFALDSLRAELQSAGIASSMLEDKDLRQILNHVGVDTQFVIDVANIRKGRWGAGRKLPLVEKPIERRREIAPARGDAHQRVR